MMYLSFSTNIFINVYIIKVIMVGSGGVGKSALTLQVSKRLNKRETLNVKFESSFSIFLVGTKYLNLVVHL